VLDNAPVGLAFFDRQHRHVRVNLAFAAMTGFTVDAHIGRTAAEVMGVPGEGLVADIDWVFANGQAVVNREVALGEGVQWLVSHYPVTVDSGVVWVGTVATEITSLRRAEHERLELLAAERRARAAAERIAVRLSRLQAVTARLTGAADADEVATVVCDHGAAGLGAVSGALMLLVDGGTTFELVRQTGYAAHVEADFKTFPADAPLPACDAVRTRSMVLLGDIAERDRRYPALAHEPAQSRAHAVVPLVFDDRVLGAVSFAFTDERSFDDDDRRFLLALASQASQALERSRLHDRERDAARRQELLAETSRLLASSLESSEHLRAVARLLVEDLADACAMQLVDVGSASSGGKKGAEMRLVTAVHGDPDRESEVLRSGISAERTDAMIVMPLSARGHELGALMLSRDPEREPFDADDVALAADIADRIAIGVDNARAHRAREEQAQTLQASLLPPRLPDIEGLTIDSRYQPIGDGSLVGGDFYDVFPLGDGAWGLMIGDVCGQGVVAASLTSLVRYTARAAARQWSSPAEVLRFTNSTLADHDLGERFCTVLFAVIEPDLLGAQLTVAIGGHHLPLLHRPGEGVAPIGTAGSALGLFDDPEISDHTSRLNPGDTLVLFTDGVIEARDPAGEQVREGFLEGIVAEHADAGPAAIGAAVERSVLELGGGRARDDMAVLVIGVGRRDVAPQATDRTFDQRYPADSASVGDARTGVREWLDAHELVPDRADDLLVALTELATNAVRAARPAIEVRAWTTADLVSIEVIDDGPGFDPAIPSDARELDPLAERGRGLFLVAAFADDCTIESGPNGTIVRCAVSR
jgi:serine phosphatase RsbU (regulator of sigma subunit)/anti-sigma regulatory factor (Ser/Thr protein kinase)/uncharacterized protein YigA (DUF484 family)